MNIIKTIDLWTEAKDNHYECFNGAFVDGFENGNIAFDRYKSDLFDKNNIQREDIDLNEKPIYKEDNGIDEIDVGSCDRWSLLYNMLRGFYTESDSEYGNFTNDKYYFIPNLLIKYKLIVGDSRLRFKKVLKKI